MGGSAPADTSKDAYEHHGAAEGTSIFTLTYMDDRIAVGVLIAFILTILLLENLLRLCEYRVAKQAYSRAYVAMLSKLYKELMILGLISFALLLGLSIAGDSVKHDQLLMFEFLHAWVFIASLFSVLHAIQFMRKAKQLNYKWESMSFLSLSTLRYQYQLQIAGNGWHSMWLRFKHKHQFFLGDTPALEQIEFRHFRRRFLERYRLPPNFDFAQYLSISISAFVSEHLEFREGIWFMYLLVLMVDGVAQIVLAELPIDKREREVIMALGFLVMGWCFFFMGYLLHWRAKRVRRNMLLQDGIKNPDELFAKAAQEEKEIRARQDESGTLSLRGRSQSDYDPVPADENSSQTSGVVEIVAGSRANSDYLNLTSPDSPSASAATEPFTLAASSALAQPSGSSDAAEPSPSPARSPAVKSVRIVEPADKSDDSEVEGGAASRDNTVHHRHKSSNGSGSLNQRMSRKSLAPPSPNSKKKRRPSKFMDTMILQRLMRHQQRKDISGSWMMKRFRYIRRRQGICTHTSLFDLLMLTQCFYMAFFVLRSIYSAFRLWDEIWAALYVVGCLLPQYLVVSRVVPSVIKHNIFVKVQSQLDHDHAQAVEDRMIAHMAFATQLAEQIRFKLCRFLKIPSLKGNEEKAVEFLKQVFESHLVLPDVAAHPSSKHTRGIDLRPGCCKRGDEPHELVIRGFHMQIIGFRKAMKSFKLHVTRKEAARVLRLLDLDRDGLITKEDWIEYVFGRVERQFQQAHEQFEEVPLESAASQQQSKNKGRGSDVYNQQDRMDRHTGLVELAKRTSSVLPKHQPGGAVTPLASGGAVHTIVESHEEHHEENYSHEPTDSDPLIKEALTNTTNGTTAREASTDDVAMADGQNSGRESLSDSLKDPPMDSGDEIVPMS